MFGQYSSADLKGDEVYLAWREAHPEVVEAEARRLSEQREAHDKAVAEYEATRLPDGEYPVDGGIVVVKGDNLEYREGTGIFWIGANKAWMTPADLPAVVQDYFDNAE